MYTYSVCVYMRERERANIAKCEQLVNLGKDYMRIHFTIFFSLYRFKTKSLFPKVARQYLKIAVASFKVQPS